jgi:hypothetical protein
MPQCDRSSSLCRDADIAKDRGAEIGDDLLQKSDPFAGEVRDWIVRPVTPPGCARVETQPAPTGSFATAKTIGMTDVARLTASTAPPPVTITSIFMRTNSSATSAKRGAHDSPPGPRQRELASHAGAI